jgi:hypothetical protein
MSWKRYTFSAGLALQQAGSDARAPPDSLCTDAVLLLQLHVREQRARTQVWLDCKPHPVDRVHRHHHRRCRYLQRSFVGFQQLDLCPADLLRLEIYHPARRLAQPTVQPSPVQTSPAVLPGRRSPPAAQQLNVWVVMGGPFWQALVSTAAAPAPRRLCAGTPGRRL